MVSLIFKKAKEAEWGDLHDLQICAFNTLDMQSKMITLLSPTELKHKYFNMEFFKVIENNILVGGAFLRKLNDVTCEIFRIFILPAKQNLGYGSMLISKIIEEYPECTEFVVNTPCILGKNINFYKKNHFISQDVIFDKSHKIKLQSFIRKVNRNAVTGLKPSDGGLHLGHYIGNISPLVKYQDIYTCYFMFADWQVLNSDIAYYDKERLLNNMRLMLKQMLALGVKPNKLKLLVESQDKTIMFEEFIWLSDFLTNSRIYRLPTIRHVKEQDKNVKLSLMCYPILQALDCIISKADVVFSNIDNKACVELINELFRKIENNGIKDYKPIKLITGKVDMLIGIDGQKMSKAKKNCILFTDSNEDLQRKVNSMYTCNRISSDAPGILDDNVVFKYLEVFASKELYAELSSKYINGKVSDAYTKEVLIDILINMFTNYRIAFDGISDYEINEILNMYK